MLCYLESRFQPHGNTFLFGGDPVSGDSLSRGSYHGGLRRRSHSYSHTTFFHDCFIACYHSIDGCAGDMPLSSESGTNRREESPGSVVDSGVEYGSAGLNADIEGMQWLAIRLLGKTQAVDRSDFKAKFCPQSGSISLHLLEDAHSEITKDFETRWDNGRARRKKSLCRVDVSEGSSTKRELQLGSCLCKRTKSKDAKDVLDGDSKNQEHGIAEKTNEDSSKDVAKLANLGRERSGTTLIIRNLPFDLSQKTIFRKLTHLGLSADVVLLYVPRSLDSKSRGSEQDNYGFIHVKSRWAESMLMKHWHNNFPFSEHAGYARRPVNIAVSRVQGAEENLQRWIASKAGRIRNANFKPMLFDEALSRKYNYPLTERLS